MIRMASMVLMIMDNGPADGDGSDPSANVPSGTTGEIVDTLI